MDVFKTLLLSPPGAVGSSVAITGGSINGTNIGATTAGTGRFTTLTTTSVTDATSTSSASVALAGGLGVGLKSFFGGDMTLVPASDAASTILLSGTASSGEAGVWFRQASPSTTNYAITGVASYTHVNAASGGTVRLRIANGNYVTLTASVFQVENVPIVAAASSNAFRITNSQTPASAAASGTAGTICWDASYIYVCTATNTWKRVAIATW